MSLLTEDQRTGKSEFLYTCPWDLLRQPAITQVAICHQWWEKGQLGTLYNRDVLTVALINAITQYDAGLSRGRYDRIDRENKRRKKEQQTAASARNVAKRN